MTVLALSALVRDYGDVYGEARTCRADCALFDFSFMARATITGAGALGALARLQPRRLDDPPGRIRYTLRLGRSPAVLADLTIWNLGGDQQALGYQLIRETSLTDILQAPYDASI